MPATAVQLPFVRDPAVRTGSKLFRKQILPLGDVTHPEHGTLTFTADRLARLRDRFLAADAMDCVPFVLVDAANAHTDDPERCVVRSAASSSQPTGCTPRSRPATGVRSC